MYLDLYFMLNLALDYWLLLVMAKLLFRDPGFFRLLAGASLGAAAAVIVACWPGFWTGLAVLLVFPLVMLLLVFWPLHWRVAVLSWLAFFLLSFLVGGAALALQSFCFPAGTGPGRGLSTLLLAGACFILYLLPARVRSFLEERKWQRRLRVKLRIKWRGKEEIITGLFDTGNRLKDPFRQRPVIIVDFRCLARLLPPEIYRQLQDPQMESWKILQELQDHPLIHFFTLVPFRSIGAAEQLMLGFSPREVTIFSDSQERTLGSEVVMGLHRRGFGAAAEYQALLPPEIMGRTKWWDGRVDSALNQA